jgi:F-type H+-transporting ATPase subunit delta
VEQRMSSADAGPEADFRPIANIQEQRIARVYAEALLDAAEQQGAVEDINAELREVVEEVFRLQPEFEDYLASGIVSKETREQALNSIFKGKASDLFLNTLLVLNEHDRLSLLRPMYQLYNHLNNERHKRIPVLVTTAVPLTEDQAGRLVSYLHDTLQLQPVLKTIIDPAILGGMIVRVGDRLFDGSVRNELVTIRKQLMARSSHEIQSRRDSFSN